jgi:cyclophilin family peptidyl-prolyl cis-trans isomerase
MPVGTQATVKAAFIEDIKKTGSEIILANEGKYDGVVFHRVIEGFMAQTGDVQFGNSSLVSFDLGRAGTGGSNLPDLPAEFSNIPHEKGTLSMARSSDPNSGNSQFFICLESAPHLDRNYTVFGKVIEGMDFVGKIKRGDGPNGAVLMPDKIISFKSL